MEVLLLAAAGLVGTSAMLGAMLTIHYLKLANADMVRAVGSVLTRSVENSFFWGLMIHYCIGVGFGFAYALLVGAAPIETAGSVIVITTLAGLVHGLIVGLFLAVAVAEHHPVKQFRQAGFGVVVAHVIGHIVYGLSVGIFISLNWNALHELLSDLSVGKFLGEMAGFAFIWLPLFGVPIVFFGYLVYVFSQSKSNESLHGNGNKQSEHSSSGDVAGKKNKPILKIINNPQDETLNNKKQRYTKKVA